MTESVILSSYRVVCLIACSLIGLIGGFIMFDSIGAILGASIGAIAGKWLSRKIDQDHTEVL